MSLTDDGEAQCLNRIFTDAAIKKGGLGVGDDFNYSTDGFYIALYTTDPTDTGGGAEVTGTGYLRKAIAFTAISTVTAGTNTISNTSPIEWASIGGTWSGGTDIGYFGIHLGASGTNSGEMIAYGTITTPKPATSGDTVTIAAGAIDISFA